MSTYVNTANVLEQNITFKSSTRWHHQKKKEKHNEIRNDVGSKKSPSLWQETQVFRKSLFLNFIPACDVTDKHFFKDLSSYNLWINRDATIHQYIVLWVEMFNITSASVRFVGAQTIQIKHRSENRWFTNVVNTQFYSQKYLICCDWIDESSTSVL